MRKNPYRETHLASVNSQWLRPQQRTQGRAVLLGFDSNQSRYYGSIGMLFKRTIGCVE
jgi:hypothetical protein